MSAHQFPSGGKQLSLQAPLPADGFYRNITPSTKLTCTHLINIDEADELMLVPVLLQTLGVRNTLQAVLNRHWALVIGFNLYEHLLVAPCRMCGSSAWRVRIWRAACWADALSWLALPHCPVGRAPPDVLHKPALYLVLQPCTGENFHKAFRKVGQQPSRRDSMCVRCRLDAALQARQGGQI